jgi:hypothetical protein
VSSAAADDDTGGRSKGEARSWKFGQPVHFVLLDVRFERAAAERPMRP